MRPSSSTARHRLMPPSYCICCRAVVPAAAAAAYRRSAYRGATTSTGSGPGRLCRRSNPRHAAIPRKQQRGRHPAAPSALPEPQAAAAAALLLVAGTVAAGTLVLRSSSSSSSSASSSGSSQQRREGLAAGGEAEAGGDGEECPDCGGTGLCGLCKGEGFVFKQLSEETATKARKAAKNMATRYTAGLPTKWTYCNKCSSTRSCTTCRGSGRIASTPSLL
ncbi:hypothetical protein BS78_08G120700 [Paspalum vaginatum]|nr:hypothetical protein BS78_08G120700 [Paspalum vaginatum]